MKPRETGTQFDSTRMLIHDSGAQLLKTQCEVRALFQALVSWIIAAVLALGLHHRIAGTVVATVGGLILLCGLFLPSAFLALERATHKVAEWVTTILTWCLLIPFFYLCFAPARLVLVLTKTDLLQRRRDKTTDSYWVDWPHSQRPEDYTRQY